MTLQEIKNQVAKNNGYDQLEDCTYAPMRESLNEEVTRRYATVAVEEFRSKIIKEVNLPPRKEEAVLSMPIELP